MKKILLFGVAVLMTIIFIVMPSCPAAEFSDDGTIECDVLQMSFNDHNSWLWEWYDTYGELPPDCEDPLYYVDCG